MKWCCYCQKDNHDDNECHSTRSGAFRCRLSSGGPGCFCRPAGNKPSTPAVRVPAVSGPLSTPLLRALINRL
jgi:hypothetical protein